ncbi:thioredoxin [Candidatus Binatia bacterium]|nr:thioredoxin [Candidatus Binatia bacterium]
MTQWQIDVGDADFETAVVERSSAVPIVVDFWAEWCAPCRQLAPMLERLADEHRGAFVLAKCNIDQNPAVASALGIQSIPTVLGFRDRQVVAEFVGAQPESVIRQFLEQVLPGEADRAAAAAAEALAAGRNAEAEMQFRHALELDARCDRARVGLAALLRDRGEYVEALDVLERVTLGWLRHEADRLAAEIRVRQSGGGADLAALRARVAVAPADFEARFSLAQALGSGRQYEAALREYLEIVRRDRAWHDGAARKAMIDIFDLLGGDDPLTGRYRSELAKILFS